MVNVIYFYSQSVKLLFWPINVYMSILPKKLGTPSSYKGDLYLSTKAQVCHRSGQENLCNCAFLLGVCLHNYVEIYPLFLILLSSVPLKPIFKIKARCSLLSNLCNFKLARDRPTSGANCQRIMYSEYSNLLFRTIQRTCNIPEPPNTL